MNFCIDCGADIPGTEENEGVYLCATCAREHDTPAEGKGGMRAMYYIHAASIEASGLRLSAEPRAQADTLSAALALAADPANHGPEGAAIVCPDGRTIYSAEEYDRAGESLRMVYT